MIEIIPKLFIGSIPEAKDFQGTVISLATIYYGEKTDVIWIPLTLKGKLRKQQLNMFAMFLYSELANNKNVLVHGSNQTNTAMNLRLSTHAVTFFLHIMKSLPIEKAFNIIKQKITEAEFIPGSYEPRILEDQPIPQ